MKLLALLRGINVSGQKIIKMEDLRKLMETAGFTDVGTFIQSGNILFSTERSKSESAKIIGDAIKDKYGFDVGIIILDKSKLEKTIKNNPYIRQGAELKSLYVVFLSDKPSTENLEKLKATPTGDDEFVLIDDILYVNYDSSAGNSKLSNALIEKKLNVVSTMRNWNTVNKLLHLLIASDS